MVRLKFRALRIYPNGNKARGGDQHVSLYLTRKKDPVNRPSEVTVTIKFFIQDQLSGEYLVIEGKHTITSLLSIYHV